MAIVDYGAILKVNGKFTNKNKDLFMEQTDMNYKPKNKNIEGCVIAGDENFLLSFYKGSCYIYHNEREINSIHWSPFIKETVYNKNLPNVTIEHLDKKNKIPYLVADSWSEFMLCKGILLNNKEEIKMSKSKYPKIYKQYLRYLDFIRRYNKKHQYYTSRWKATWDYKGNHYEVIFGVGIDPNEKVWNRIKYDCYDFTDIERNIIDKWFKGENN